MVHINYSCNIVTQELSADVTHFYIILAALGIIMQK